MVKGGDLGGTEALSDGNDRRVDCTKAEIGILLNQLRRPFEVGLGRVLDAEAPGDETAEEGTLDRCLGALGKQATHLGGRDQGRSTARSPSETRRRTPHDRDHRGG